jgi:hypothetical protein
MKPAYQPTRINPMPFEAIESRQYRSLDNYTPVMAFLTVTKKGGTPYASMSLRIDAAALSKLGWKRGDRVIVSEGNGSDIGCLELSLLTGAGKGHMLSSYNGPNSGVVVVSISSTRFKHHAFPETTQHLTPVAYQAFGGRMTLMFPDWVSAKAT